jgi:hypothetical protein
MIYYQQEQKKPEGTGGYEQEDNDDKTDSDRFGTCGSIMTCSSQSMLKIHGHLLDALCLSDKYEHWKPMSNSLICATLGSTEELAKVGMAEPHHEQGQCVEGTS